MVHIGIRTEKIVDKRGHWRRISINNEFASIDGDVVQKWFVTIQAFIESQI